MYYYLVSLVSILLGCGILLSKFSFFKMTVSTLSLLDTILDSQTNEEEKQKILINRVGKLLSSLFLFILVAFAVLTISTIPVLVFAKFDINILPELDNSSYLFYACLSLPSLIPFILFSRRKVTSDYSEWSVILHRIILDNYNVAKSLFKIEKSIFKKKLSKNEQPFVIVTGLARAGTTALTTLLYKSSQFHALTYANVPFLMAPNLWKKVYNPKSGELKERNHGDSVLFGYDSVEALEEPFFKAMKNDSFITNTGVYKHEIDEKLYQDYLNYQNLLKESDTLYLAKNNNFMLRYDSLRKLDKNFKVVLIYRSPLEHAYSLMKQNERFTALQNEDPFTLEYMNWLAHHEFGNNTLPLMFDPNTKFTSTDKSNIDYWLEVWNNYYKMVASLADDNNLILLSYTDFLEEPEKVVQHVESLIGRSLNLGIIEKFTKIESFVGTPNKKLYLESQNILSNLEERKIKL